MEDHNLTPWGEIVGQAKRIIQTTEEQCERDGVPMEGIPVYPTTLVEANDVIEQANAAIVRLSQRISKLDVIQEVLKDTLFKMVTEDNERIKDADDAGYVQAVLAANNAQVDKFIKQLHDAKVAVESDLKDCENPSFNAKLAFESLLAILSHDPYSQI